MRLSTWHGPVSVLYHWNLIALQAWLVLLQCQHSLARSKQILEAHASSFDQPCSLYHPVEHEAMGDYMDKTFMFWSQSQGVQQQA